MSKQMQSDGERAWNAEHRDGVAFRRALALSVVFLHCDSDTIYSCIEELKTTYDIASVEIILHSQHRPDALQPSLCDVVIAEYPKTAWKIPAVLQFLHEIAREVPVLVLTTKSGRETATEFAADGIFEYVERKRLYQLPMAVRRILRERKLRAELEGARKALQHSQSLYRALVDNPDYGIFRCNSDGVVIDVNQALTDTLGYASRADLLAANRTTGLLSNLAKNSAQKGYAADASRIHPFETEWKRRDGTTLKARLSGRAIFDDAGNFAGLEVIVIDITEQQALADQLRYQASTDSLTGLANHRRLFQTLHGEICRSQRTGRAFSLVLFDLDALKRVNDRNGHLAGDRALCRLAQILKDSCRSVDTAARQGGHEFALVLPETEFSAANVVARRICDLLEKEEDEVPALSVSTGIACYPHDAETIGTLLYAADRALHAAKDNRRRAENTEPSTLEEVFDLKKTL